jgi:hypothetical protein
MPIPMPKPIPKAQARAETQNIQSPVPSAAGQTKPSPFGNMSKNTMILIIILIVAVVVIVFIVMQQKSTSQKGNLSAPPAAPNAQAEQDNGSSAVIQEDASSNTTDVEDEPEYVPDQIFVVGGTWPPREGDVLVAHTEPARAAVIRSAPVVDGAQTETDGNQIGYIYPGDTSVQLIATGEYYEDIQDGHDHMWIEVKIPQWYRDTGEQSTKYGGRPLVGWVGSDLVELFEG